jgi:carbamoyl-phosphate synthase large subunit
MMQEILSEPSDVLNNEYTCSIFKTKSGKILGPFTSRRTLRSGNSWVIEVKEFKELFPLLLKIGKIFPILGTLNIQLMLTKDGPIPFEFNARFSGTTAIRSYFGFNEPEMCIKNFYLNQEIESPKIRSGMSFRYLEEVFLDDYQLSDLGNKNEMGKIKNWF